MNNMIEIFRTNIESNRQVQLVKHFIKDTLPTAQINVDLEDYEKILRIEYPKIDPQQITKLLKGKGFQCEVLPD